MEKKKKYWHTNPSAHRGHFVVGLSEYAWTIKAWNRNSVKEITVLC